MVIEPVQLQNIFSHKASADGKSADAVLGLSIDKKNPVLQKLLIGELLHNKNVSTPQPINAGNLSNDTVALSGLQERIQSILHAFTIVPSPLAQKAVLLAISEGLKLTPSLIRRIMHVLEQDSHNDAVTLIRALDEDDGDTFGKALELLTKLRTSCQHDNQDKHNHQGEHNEGQSPLTNHAMITETEEKHAIISQFQMLLMKCLGIGMQEKKQEVHTNTGTTTDTLGSKGNYVSNFTWIHVPFAFIEGSLNLTGYLRMVYNYYTKKVERLVLECVDKQAERLAVIEAGKALFWSSSNKECVSAERQGLMCVSQKDTLQVCALCGINTIIGVNHEKK